MAYAVYIMASRRNGTLYIGVTGDLARRHGVKRLVWYEWQEDIARAIQREKTLKHWPRRWKLAAIEQVNPAWDDLALAL